MLEWYRAGAPLGRLIEDCVALTALAAHVAGAKTFVFRGRKASPFEPPELLTVRDAFRRFAGVDIYDSLPIGGRPDAEALASQAKEAGVRVTPDDTWSDIFSRFLSERVEPNLGIGRPTLLHAYPATEAALARLDPDDPRVAERFEFYCCGVELANAFHELDRSGRAATANSKPTWTSRSAFTGHPRRSTRISSPRSPRCPTLAARRSGSTV